jgi:hypothetical protein
MKTKRKKRKKEKETEKGRVEENRGRRIKRREKNRE